MHALKLAVSEHKTSVIALNVPAIRHSTYRDEFQHHVADVYTVACMSSTCGLEA